MRLQDALRDYTVSDALDNWKIVPIKKDYRMNKDASLKPGQIIRYGPALYRVDYVNECRARIVPLAKKHGHELEGESGGISIAATSFVEIITDLERARIEMELADAEKELAAAKAEMALRGKLEAELAAADAELAEARKELGLPTAASPAGPPAHGASVRAGWLVVAGSVPEYKPGSLAARVLAYIVAHPGQNTKEIVAGVGGEGAIAACVSRFSQAGLIEKKQ